MRLRPAAPRHACLAPPRPALRARPLRTSSDHARADNHIDTGDDCIAIKSGWDAAGLRVGRPASNISIADTFCSTPRHAAVAIGSEMSGGVHGVRVRNLTVARSGSALRVKMGPGRGGTVSDVEFRDSQVRDVTNAFMFTMDYDSHPDVGYDLSALPELVNVTVTNVTGTANESVAIVEGLCANPDAVCTDRMRSKRRSARGLHFAGVGVRGGAWRCARAWGVATGTPDACSCLEAGCMDESAVGAKAAGQRRTSQSQALTPVR